MRRQTPTPGPWRFEAGGCASSHGLPIVTDSRGHLVAECASHNMANAALIAAAPALLAALLASVRAVDAGELLVRWSDEYVRENGLDSPAANQDSARKLLRDLGCEVLA